MQAQKVHLRLNKYYENKAEEYLNLLHEKIRKCNGEESWYETIKSALLSFAIGMHNAQFEQFGTYSLMIQSLDYVNQVSCNELKTSAYFLEKALTECVTGGTFECNPMGRLEELINAPEICE